MGIDCTRRGFLGGVCAAFGGLLLPADAFGAGTPDLKLGVVSDVHVGADTGGHAVDMDRRLERALRWFDAQGVDAVMVPGDIAHSGFIRELERFAKIWDAVFPGGRGANGRPVEKLFVTGNHDLDAWWVKNTPAWRAANLFDCADNRRTVWERLFHEEWRMIWKKVVKGYVFVGAQWPTKTVKPPIEAWFKEHAAELKGPKPFFFTQHAHPRGTCGDGKTSYDDGTATRALAAFPNAVAITGHSHQTVVDDTSVWQGAFTSINAGCLRSGANDRWGAGYDSVAPFYSPKRKFNRMKPLDGVEGGCGLLVDVFADHLVVHRRSFVHNVPLGADWCIALPAAEGGPFDPKRQARESSGPEFAPDAKAGVVRCASAPADIVGPALKGKACVHVKIPPARAPKPGSRVYDFKVELLVDGQAKLERLVLANGFNVPEEMSARVTNCLFGMDELPASGKVGFRMTPRNAFGVPGRPLVAAL